MCHPLDVFQDGLDDTSYAITLREVAFTALKMLAKIEGFRYVLLLSGNCVFELSQLQSHHLE